MVQSKGKKVQVEDTSKVASASKNNEHSEEGAASMSQIKASQKSTVPPQSSFSIQDQEESLKVSFGSQADIVVSTIVTSHEGTHAITSRTQGTGLLARNPFAALESADPNIEEGGPQNTSNLNGNKVSIGICSPVASEASPKLGKQPQQKNASIGSSGKYIPPPQRF